MSSPGYPTGGFVFVSGAPPIDPETGELVTTSELGDLQPREPDPRTMTGTDLYRDWFGVDRLLLNPLGDTLRQYNRLAADPLRTADDDKELARLEAELRASEVGDLRAPTAPADDDDIEDSP